MKTNETAVLIIGINQYATPNLSALSGARNDAIAWYKLCVGRLRIPPQNIAVLASPALTPAELGPGSELSRLRGATRAEIIEEARTLADRAASTAGLVTYSGHGIALAPIGEIATGGELCICPTDTQVTYPEEGAPSISGEIRFSELADIFRSPDCKDNITVVLDTCYSSGPESPSRRPLGKGQGAPELPDEDALCRARQTLRVGAFTNRLFLGARHWTTAYEIKVNGEWYGAATYAMTTLLSRWSIREENGIRYPNVSHADLLDRVGDFLGVLGVPQLPAIWGQRRIDEQPVLRPGVRYTPGETSSEPDGAMQERQLPVDPEKIALISIFDQSSNPVIHIVSVGSTVPSGISGVDAGTEYWYTNTTSPPSMSGLSMSVTYSDAQRDLEDFVDGWTLSIECAQNIGTSNWSTWSSGINSAGDLFRATDPTGLDTYIGLYLEYRTNGELLTYSWYRRTLITDGFAYEYASPPSTFTRMTSTDPTTMENVTWKYSLVVSPP